MKVKLLQKQKTGGVKKNAKKKSTHKKNRMCKKKRTYKKKGGSNKLSGSIVPTDDESIFESYLSILVNLLGVQEIYKMIAQPIKVISIPEKFCSSPWLYKNIPDRPEKFIYYCCKDEDINDSECEPISTHYKVIEYEPSGRSNRLDPKIRDPYGFYQISGSHGFCQMFAKFISDNDVKDFNEDKTKKGYQENTFICLQKTLKLIRENLDIYNAMKEGFNEDLTNEYFRKENGIIKDITFERFMEDLHTFRLEDVTEYIDYWLKKNTQDEM